MFLLLNFCIHVVERFPLGDHLQLPEGDVFLPNECLWALPGVFGLCSYCQNFDFIFFLITCTCL